jgi:hypothetical protein
MKKSDGKIRSYLGTPSPNFLLKEFYRKNFLIVILFPHSPKYNKAAKPKSPGSKCQLLKLGLWTTVVHKVPNNQ